MRDEGGSQEGGVGGGVAFIVFVLFSCHRSHGAPSHPGVCACRRLHGSPSPPVPIAAAAAARQVSGGSKAPAATEEAQAAPPHWAQH